MDAPITIILPGTIIIDPIVSLLTMIGIIILMSAFYFLIRKVLPKDFLKPRIWKIILISLFILLLLAGLIYGMISVPQYYSFVTYLSIILVMILSAAIWYSVLCSIESIIIIIKKKSYKKSKKPLIASIATLFIINPITMQVITLITWVVISTIYAQTHIVCGATFSGVIENTPASRSGMTAYETILQINDVAVHNPDDLANYLNSTYPGQDVRIITDKNSYDIVLDPKPGGESGFLGIQNILPKYCNK